MTRLLGPCWSFPDWVRERTRQAWKRPRLGAFWGALEGLLFGVTQAERRGGFPSRIKCGGHAGPRTAHIAPQCGSGDVLRGGHFSPPGVRSGIACTGFSHNDGIFRGIKTGIKPLFETIGGIFKCREKK